MGAPTPGLYQHAAGLSPSGGRLCESTHPDRAASPDPRVPGPWPARSSQARPLHSSPAEVPMRGLAWLLFVPVVAVYLAPALGLVGPALP